MATDLTSFNFTRGSDLARDLNDGLFNNGNVDTLLGSDTLEGAGGNIGIRNNGTIKTDRGNDDISGTGDRNGIRNDGTIYAGSGNDTLTALSLGSRLLKATIPSTLLVKANRSLRAF